MQDSSEDCPKCGMSLPPDVPRGLCPYCLLAPENSDGGTDPTIDSNASISTSEHLFPNQAELANQLPQLEILELLGYGGMGAVYKARQKGLDRLVALKIIKANLIETKGFAERFTREARALAKLSHPNIVAVHDFGKVGDLFYLIMEYVDGTDLRNLINTQELNSEQALTIVPQICGALQFAHDQGILHRDIKPENILVGRDGTVKVADFGLAKLLSEPEDTRNLTGTNQVLGTIKYMAPEQFEGSEEIDHRADIYSLGVVFYELLTGELPLGRFAVPSEKAKIDARLDGIVLRALEKDAEHRYQHASEIKEEVEEVSSTEFVHDNVVSSVSVEQDESFEVHINAVAWINIVYSCILILIGLMIFAFMLVIANNADPKGQTILRFVGLAVATILTALGIPGIFAGQGLLYRSPWARGLGLVLAGFDLINFPIGTVVGIYMFWVLLNPKCVRAFKPDTPGTRSDKFRS